MVQGQSDHQSAPAARLIHEGARRLIPISRPLVPLWNLGVVLEGLKGPPLEPLEGADRKHMSLEDVLLLTSASVKCVSDRNVLSVLLS